MKKISNPKSSIRLAGGKKLRLSEENILKLMKNCIDSTIAGNMLTTTGFTMEEERKKVLESSKTLKTLKSPSFV